MRRRALWLIVAVSLTTAFGCDSFNLFERFNTNGGLVLELEKDSVLRGETLQLYPSGGVPPYNYAVFATDLYYDGDPGSVSGTTYTAGDAIGKVSIKLSDSDGHDLYVPLVIRAPAPTGFTVAPFSFNTVSMSWSYAEPGIISGFWLYRSIDGGPFALIKTLGSEAINHTDTALNTNKTYTYRLYAVSGIYLSVPTPDVSPP